MRAALYLCTDRAVVVMVGYGSGGVNRGGGIS